MGGNSKRRLSKGGKASALPVHEEELTIDEDLNIQSNSRRNSFARRRQSVGKSATMEETAESLQEQNRIADMYKSIIKMSSENKINAKNSWNLDLINHMDKMIKSDEGSQRSGHKGVNFQKASCTLDASIKIYSHRVDDTWSSSYRILENLSRSEHIEEDDLDDDDDDDKENEARKKKSSRVGSKSNSNKLNLVSTIEKNVDNINFKVQENSHTADPMFHKMSQAFDEGGAKGMLMSNLRVTPQSSTITFSTLNQQQELSSETHGEECTVEDNVKMEDSANKQNTEIVFTENKSILTASNKLLSRSGFQIDALLSKPVCSSLDKYRDTLGIVPCTQARYEDCAPLLHSDSFNFEEDNTPDCDVGNIDVGSISDDDDDDNNEDNTYFGESSLTAEALATLDNSAKRRSSGSSDNMSIYSSTSKIQWDAVYDDDDNNSICSSNVISDAGSGVLSVNDTKSIGFQSGNSTAAFLAMNTGATNQWAGAKHWRRSARVKSAKKVNSEEESTIKEKKGRAKTKKEKFRFDFTKVGEGVSEQINAKFEKVKGSRKLNPTLLSDTVVQKGISQAKEGVYCLPADARLNVKDLCRLFHWSSMIVPPANTVDELKQAICAPSALSYRYAGMSGDQLLKAQVGKRRRSSNGVEDTIWKPPMQQDPVHSDDEFDDNSPGDFYDDDDNDDIENFVPESSNVSSGKVTSGLSIQVAGGLLEAPRKVNKLNIGYAKSSKRVNVKKLKSDLWTKLEKDCSAEAIENISTSERPSTADTKELSFQEVIGDIAQDQTQKDASLSFYFICLLHLANEKNLSIKDSGTLDDLMISQGSSF